MTKNVYERTAYCIVHSPNRSRETHLALDLLEKDYKNYFDFIIIICSTLTYQIRNWIWTDPYVTWIEPGNHLYDWIEKIGNLFAGLKTLFLIDDIIADEALDKRRQPLLELAISGRHRGHLLGLLTQSYTAIPKNIRRQTKMLYVWYPKNRTDLSAIHEENNVIETQEVFVNVKKKLKRSKHKHFFCSSKENY